MYLDLLYKPMECHVALHSLQPELGSAINTRTSAMGAMTAIAAIGHQENVKDLKIA
jgi:hypothetical protein